MRVLFVTPECAPLIKTGGLGDVAGALPAALRAQGNDVRVLLPRYREIDTAGAQERARVRLLGMEARVLEKGDCLLVDVPELYDREGAPTRTPPAPTGPTTRCASACSRARRRSSHRAPRRLRGGRRSCMQRLAHGARTGLSAFRARPRGQRADGAQPRLPGDFRRRPARAAELAARHVAIEGLEFYGRLRS